MDELSVDDDEEEEEEEELDVADDDVSVLDRDDVVSVDEDSI